MHFKFILYCFATDSINDIVSSLSVKDCEKKSSLLRPRLDMEIATFPAPPNDIDWDNDFTIGAGPSGDNFTDL